MDWMTPFISDTILYLILIVIEFLFREGPDSEVNSHGLLLSTACHFSLQTKKTIRLKPQYRGALEFSFRVYVRRFEQLTAWPRKSEKASLLSINKNHHTMNLAQNEGEPELYCCWIRTEKGKKHYLLG